MGSNPLSKVWFTPTHGAQQLAVAVVASSCCSIRSTKALVIGTVTVRNDRVLPLLDIVYLHNTGAAFSFLAQASRLAALVLHRCWR